jgi:hypothetical protein
MISSLISIKNFIVHYQKQVVDLWKTIGFYLSIGVLVMAFVPFDCEIHQAKCLKSLCISRDEMGFLLLKIFNYINGVIVILMTVFLLFISSIQYLMKKMGLEKLLKTKDENSKTQFVISFVILFAGSHVALMLLYAFIKQLP